MAEIVPAEVRGPARDRGCLGHESLAGRTTVETVNLSALGIGMAIGVALWVATENAVYIGVGVAIGIALGFIDRGGGDRDGNE